MTRHENLDLLKQNSFVVYIKRDLAELAAEGRPLSMEIGVEALAKQRQPLYEAWSDSAFCFAKNKNGMGF